MVSDLAREYTPVPIPLTLQNIAIVEKSSLFLFYSVNLTILLQIMSVESLIERYPKFSSYFYFHFYNLSDVFLAWL